jgi:hypothetical protein
MKPRSRMPVDGPGTRGEADSSDQNPGNVGRGLNFEDLCVCGHDRLKHLHDRDCIALNDIKSAKFCTCYKFRRADAGK